MKRILKDRLIRLELYQQLELHHRRNKHHFLLLVLQWWGGYTRHNEIWRIKMNLQNQEIIDELITKNHAVMMYNPLLE